MSFQFLVKVNLLKGGLREAVVLNVKLSLALLHLLEGRGKRLDCLLFHRMENQTHASQVPHSKSFGEPDYNIWRKSDLLHRIGPTIGERLKHLKFFVVLL